MPFLGTDSNANRRRMFDSCTICILLLSIARKSMIFERDRGSASGALHHWFGIRDMSELPQDPQYIGVIDGIINGLSFASGADNVCPPQADQSLDRAD